MKTLIIAEAGINHNRSVTAAKMLCDHAKKAGADVVKFQLEQPSEYTLTWKEQEEVYRHCQRIDMKFACTAFDVPSLQFLLDHTKLEIVKIASKCTDKALMRLAGKTGLPVVLSTGASSLIDVQANIEAIIGEPYREQTVNMLLLHCISAYPAPYDQTNLRAIHTLRMHFLLPAGFSDHSVGIELPIAAITYGAFCIEKHLTLDRRAEGPDHACSVEVGEFTRMVNSIRNIEVAMGDGIKKPQACEL